MTDEPTDGFLLKGAESPTQDLRAKEIGPLELLAAVATLVGICKQLGAENADIKGHNDFVSYRVTVRIRKAKKGGTK